MTEVVHWLKRVTVKKKKLKVLNPSRASHQPDSNGDACAAKRVYNSNLCSGLIQFKCSSILAAKAPKSVSAFVWAPANKGTATGLPVTLTPLTYKWQNSREDMSLAGTGRFLPGSLGLHPPK